MTRQTYCADPRCGIDPQHVQGSPGCAFEPMAIESKRLEELLAMRHDHSIMPGDPQRRTRAEYAYAELREAGPALAAEVLALRADKAKMLEAVEQIISAWAFAHDIDGGARNDLFKRLHTAINDSLKGGCDNAN